MRYALESEEGEGRSDASKKNCRFRRQPVSEGRSRPFRRPAAIAPKPPAGERLSAADAAFIYLERKEIPLHIASVSIFDGAIPFEKFVASIEAKLSLVPRWRQVVWVPSLNLGLPAWQDDPNFDIHRHIFHMTLPRPGGQAELEALAGRTLTPLMDRSKPLWDVTVVDGLKGGRGALIWRVHHSLADGVAGAGLLQVMLDHTPGGERPVLRPHLRRAPPKAGEGGAGGVIGSAVQGTLNSLMVAEKGVLGLAHSLFGEQVQSGLKGLASLLPELAIPVERLPFNKPCGGERRFFWTEFDLGRAQAVREIAGGTVNDVILTVLTRALGRYVKLHGQSVVNRFVRIVCPVNLRNGEHNGELGNRISFLPVALPMDARGPLRMLREVAARTSTMKRSGAAGLVGLAAALLAAAPASFQAAFWWAIPEVILPWPLLNLICTNIPGSPVPLYAGGRRMLASYPQVPTGYDLGVGCAVQSYNGKLCVGLIADAKAAPDADRLRDLISESFDELCRSVGLTPPKLRRPPAARRAPVPRGTRKRSPERVPSPDAGAAASPAGLPSAAPASAEKAA